MTCVMAVVHAYMHITYVVNISDIFVKPVVMLWSELWLWCAHLCAQPCALGSERRLLSKSEVRRVRLSRLPVCPCPPERDATVRP